jgi:hypothetical protein
VVKYSTISLHKRHFGKGKLIINIPNLSVKNDRGCNCLHIVKKIANRVMKQ